MNDQPEPRPQRPRAAGRMDEFSSWHRDKDFVKGVYGQALGNLIAAAAIYAVAAYSGLVNDAALVVVLTLTTVATGLMLLFVLPRVFKNWSEVRPLFVVWNTRTDPEAVDAKNTYTTLIFRLYAFVFSVILLGAALLT